MDPLASFLDGPRAREAFLLRSLLEPPWALRIRDEAPLTVVALVRGQACVVFDDEPPTRLDAGDVAVIRGPSPYTLADDPGTAPSAVIHPGQVCETPDGRPLAGAMDLGVRTWGTSPTGAVTMLTGTYETDGEASQRVLDALPRLTVVRARSWRSPLVGILAQEICNDQPGQQVVLDRLLDLLLVAVLREAFAHGGADVPAWYRADSDPVVGRALRLIHNDPAHPWTVAGLAAAVGVSRASLARRFREQVGEPPLAYLTTWRMALAADLLREADATVGRVAATVGYGSPFTFSTAFKRAVGVSPRAHRLSPVRPHVGAPGADPPSR